MQEQSNNIQSEQNTFTFNVNNSKKHTQKPKNMLILQENGLAKCINLHTLEQAFQKMISLYSQIISTSNPQTPQIQYSLQAMCQYYQSLQDMMYIEKKDNQSKGKQIEQMHSYQKDYLIEKMKQYCVRKSVEKSIELGRKIFESGLDIQQTLKNLGCESDYDDEVEKQQAEQKQQITI